MSWAVYYRRPFVSRLDCQDRLVEPRAHRCGHLVKAVENQQNPAGGKQILQLYGKLGNTQQCKIFMPLGPYRFTQQRLLPAKRFTV